MVIGSNLTAHTSLLMPPTGSSAPSWFDRVSIHGESRIGHLYQPYAWCLNSVALMLTYELDFNSWKDFCKSNHIAMCELTLLDFPIINLPHENMKIFIAFSKVSHGIFIPR